MWPSWPDREELAKRSNGLFCWAAAACAWIATGTDPRERTRSILDMPPQPIASQISRLYGLLVDETCQRLSEVRVLENSYLSFGALAALRGPQTWLVRSSSGSRIPTTSTFDGTSPHSVQNRHARAKYLPR
jgi:hypothetical protein